MLNKTIVSFVAILFIHASLLAQSGLVGEYFNGTDFEEKKMTRNDDNINFFWDRTAPARGMDPQSFSIRWTGQIKAPKSGKYVFRALVDDGIRVYVNGQMVINAWSLNDNVELSGSITLKAGELYDLKVEYFNGLLEGEVRLYWQLPGDEPTFGGLFGYNDKVIDAKYLYQPKPAVTPKPTPPPAAKPAPKPKPTPPPVATPKPTPPAPKPAPKPAVVAKDTLERYIPKNVMFEQGKSILLESSFKSLDELAGFLVRNRSLKVSIEGHTDVHGDSAKNLELSEERAKRVASYLVKKGVDASRLATKGYGDTRPLSKEKNATGYAQNRRVEFVLTQ